MAINITSVPEHIITADQ